MAPQGDRVQRRFLHARHTYTQSDTARGFVHCMHGYPAARIRCVCHVTIVSVQMQHAQIVHTPFTTVHVQRSTIDIISETNRHQTPSPPNDQFSFLKNIGKLRTTPKRVTVEDPDYRPKRTRKTPKKFIDFDCMASELSDGIGQEEKDIGQPAQKGEKH